MPRAAWAVVHSEIFLYCFFIIVKIHIMTFSFTFWTVWYWRFFFVTVIFGKIKLWDLIGFLLVFWFIYAIVNRSKGKKLLLNQARSRFETIIEWSWLLLKFEINFRLTVIFQPVKLSYQMKSGESVVKWIIFYGTYDFKYRQDKESFILLNSIF